MKCSRNSPSIIEVSFPHRLLQVRHSGLIKRGQSAGREDRMIKKSFCKGVACCEQRYCRFTSSVYLLRKPWEWKLEQAAGKMSRKAWMVVVESHRYRIRSTSSYDHKENTFIINDSVTLSACCSGCLLRSLSVTISKPVNSIFKYTSPTFISSNLRPF